MCAFKQERKPGLFFSLLTNKCPRCRRGKLFKTDNAYALRNFMKMYDRCPSCGQPTELEVGFYYGTGFVSYGLSIGLCVVSFITWWILIGFSLHDNRLFWWILVNSILLIGLQPLLMRLSRTIWLWFFVRYDPDWDKGDPLKPERINEDLKNAW